MLYLVLTISDNDVAADVLILTDNDVALGCAGNVLTKDIQTLTNSVVTRDAKAFADTY